MRKIILSSVAVAVAVFGLVGFALVSRAAPVRHQSITKHVSSTSSNKQATIKSRGTYTVHNSAGASAAKSTLKGSLGFKVANATSKALSTSSAKSRTTAKKPNTVIPNGPPPCLTIADGSTFAGFTAVVIDPTSTVTGAISAAKCNIGVYVGPGHTAAISGATILDAGVLLSVFAPSAEVVNNGGTLTITNSTLSFGNDFGLYAQDGFNTITFANTPASTSVSGSTIEFNGDVFGGFGIFNEQAFAAAVNLTATNDTVDNNFLDQVFNVFATLTINGGTYLGGPLQFSGSDGILNAFALAVVNNATVTDNTDAGVYNLFGSATLNYDTVTNNAQSPFLIPAADVYNDFAGVLKITHGTYGLDDDNFFAPDAIFDGGTLGSTEVDDAVIQGEPTVDCDLDCDADDVDTFPDANFIGFENFSGGTAILGNDRITNAVVGVANHANFFGPSVTYLNASWVAGNYLFGVFNGDFAASFDDGSTLLMYSTTVTGNVTGSFGVGAVVNYGSFWGNNDNIKNNVTTGVWDGCDTFVGCPGNIAATATVKFSTITGNDASQVPFPGFQCDVAIAVGAGATFGDGTTTVGTFCLF